MTPQPDSVHNRKSWVAMKQKSHTGQVAVRTELAFWKKTPNISSLSDLKPPIEVAQIWFEKLGFVVMGPGGRIQATWAYCVNTEWNGSFF